MNTKTRKIIAMILGLALTISLFGGVTVFAAGTITVGLSAPSAVNNNSTIAVKASVTANDSVLGGLLGYSVKITYNTAKFNYTSIAKSVATPSTGVISINNDSANGILYVVYYADDPEGSTSLTPIVLDSVLATDLFTATFTAKATGAASFSIAGIDGTEDFVDTTSKVVATYTQNSSTPLNVTVNAAYVVGDLNSDSVVDAVDALLSLQYTVQLVTLTGNNLLAADVNHDSSVDAVDALIILQFTVGLVTIS